jgi:hypothetical protein
MRLDGIARVNALLRARLRTILAVLALLATVLRLSAAVVMPLAMQPVAPVPANEDYARFVAIFGPDVTICAAMPEKSKDSGSPPSRPSNAADCFVCPLCTSLRAAATAMLLPTPPPPVPHPLLLAENGAPLPADDRLHRRPFAPALARAPPSVT